MASVRDILQNLARDYAIAWSSGNPDELAGFYTGDAQITVNRDTPAQGRAAVADMLGSFHGTLEAPELRCDMLRWAGRHAVFVWTLEGRHSASGREVVLRGWDDWDLDAENRITAAQIWYDAEEYQRQIDG